jgi:predicted nuclease of predicted toxin-antitoxin system
MKVLLDGCVPRLLRRYLTNHEVKAAPQIGWGELQNGDLIKAAEKEFDVFVTADKNLRYQQNLKDRKLAIVVVPTNNWPLLEKIADKVVAAVDAAAPGSFTEL